MKFGKDIFYGRKKDFLDQWLKMSPHDRAVIDELNARTDKLLAEANRVRLLNERIRKEDNPVKIAST